MIKSFFRNFCSKEFKASSLKIIRDCSGVSYNLLKCPLDNKFLIDMNERQPQLTGMIIESALSELFTNPTMSPNAIESFHKLHGESQLLRLIEQNMAEYQLFLSQINHLIINMINFTPAFVQDDLTFKKSKCCKSKTYKCFADVVTNKSIIDIKVVRSSFFTHDNKISHTGIKYYNQLMCYACGYKMKYNEWPEKLILLNCYTGEILTWKPNIQQYQHFFDSC